MEELGRLEKQSWVCQLRQKAIFSMNFCRDTLTYDPALIASKTDEGETLSALIARQEQAAITMYAYHLAGMGIEYWDHTRPSEDADDCVKSVWRMTCYTYFPNAAVGCQEGQE